MNLTKLFHWADTANLDYLKVRQFPQINKSKKTCRIRLDVELLVSDRRDSYEYINVTGYIELIVELLREELKPNTHQMREFIKYFPEETEQDLDCL